MSYLPVIGNTPARLEPSYRLLRKMWVALVAPRRASSTC
jgi:hypothetical protein